MHKVYLAGCTTKYVFLLPKWHHDKVSRCSSAVKCDKVNGNNLKDPGFSPQPKKPFLIVIIKR